MYTRLLIVVAVWHCAIMQVSSLQCYNCLGCRTVSSDDLVDCAEQLKSTTSTLAATNETSSRLINMPNVFNFDGLSEETLKGSRADSYYCYKFTGKVYETTAIVRGCDKKVTNQNICKALEGRPDLAKDCSTCEKDKCNGASTTQLSLLVTFVTMALSLTAK